MGGSISTKYQSTNDYAQIYMQLDRPFYYAGEEIQGTVYLYVLNIFPIDKLMLRIKGLEKTSWETEKTETKDNLTQTIQVQHKGKNTVLDATCPLFAFTTLGPGQYSFPFKYRLDSNLPGTFEIKGVNEAWTKIKKVKVFYTMAITLVSLNPNVCSTIQLPLLIRPAFPEKVVNINQTMHILDVY